MPHHNNVITRLVEECYDESEIDNKVQILFKINSLLPKSSRINIPPLITDDYINTVLFEIEKHTQVLLNNEATALHYNPQ